MASIGGCRVTLVGGATRECLLDEDAAQPAHRVSVGSYLMWVARVTSVTGLSRFACLATAIWSDKTAPPGPERNRLGLGHFTGLLCR
jgi:hypothetical protein